MKQARKARTNTETIETFENLPGDSKDMLKLKKKLREIVKIEERQAAGELLEPTQEEKASKKQQYLEELRLLLENGQGAGA